MRRARKIKHEIKPDQKYGSVLVAKFINKVMLSGEKSVSRQIVYKAFENIEAKLKKPALEVFETVIKTVAPQLEVKSRRIGGATYQVPREVRGERKETLAIRWLIQAARAGKSKPVAEKLADEIIAAMKGEGLAIKKRNDTHRMAEANKAFAHFSW